MRRPSFLLVALVPALLAPPAEAKLYDFNNDRRQDLVVGLPGWDTNSGNEVAALVALGSKRNLLRRARVIKRSSLGVYPMNTPVGLSIASADFDGDDFEDLALGVPEAGDHGSVAIAYGSRIFPRVRRTTILRGQSDNSRQSGEAMTAGDLNGENRDDLAVGAGDLEIFFGSREVLSDPPDRTILAPSEAGFSFGYVIAHGDINDDGHNDVFEASPGSPRFVSEPPDPGHVFVALGSGEGPRPFQPVAQEMRGGPSSLAIGDVNGDSYGDLVGGVPINDFIGEDDPGPPGAVMIWWGGADGLSDEPTTITQNSPGIPGSNQEHDRFGTSVAVGRLDRDRYADIVVGAPIENNHRGRVTIIRGGPRGYARKGNRRFGFGTPGVPGNFGRGDRDFGSELSLLDFNGDDRLDLALADRGHDRSRLQRSRRGGVTVLRGTRRGISFKGAARLNFFSRGVVPRQNSEFPRLGRAGSSN